ncbi:hypothetical protein Sjap_022171 [Stephania japonica]|uniref:Uncharacterized protein n=1 Tax=Stephania japonica TaxID=461633 RepID=A0AAP0HSJ3_9MAGN
MVVAAKSCWPKCFYHLHSTRDFDANKQCEMVLTSSFSVSEYNILLGISSSKGKLS